jgi:hypothetical protein
MKKIGIFILIMGLITLTACQSNDEVELLDKSKEFAKEFIMKEENVEFVVEEAEFTTAIGKGTIFVRGYVKGDQSDSITVLVHYDEKGNLSSDSWGRGKGEVEQTPLDEFINEVE